MADNEADLHAEIARLNTIIEALMNRVERSTDLQGSDFNLFQSTILLEAQVRARTADLAQALQENENIARMLRDSEARYRALVNQSLIGIAVVQDGKITYSNPRYREIFGFTESDLCEMSPEQTVIEEDRARVHEQIRKRLSGETDLAHYHVRACRKDGSLRHVEIFGNTAEIAGEKVLITSILDVTERVQAEASKRESEQRLRAILDNSLVGIVISRMEDGLVEEVNDTFLSMSGYARDEVIGKHSSEVGFWPVPAQREQLLVKLQLGKLLEGFQMLFRTRSGEMREMLFSCKVVNLHGVQSLIGAVMDITELKRTRSALEREGARLQGVIDANPCGMALFDAGHRLVGWNKRFKELLQYPPELLDRKDIRIDDLIRFSHARGDFPGKNLLEVIETFTLHALQGRPLHLQCRAGSDRYLEIDMTALPGKETLVSYVDITTHTQEEQQMRSLANHDSLTQLPNRRFLLDKIRSTLQESKDKGHCHAAMLIDLDEFKAINDRFGHQAGDALLIEAAGRLQRCVRSMDTVARIGGDEFVVMLTNLDRENGRAIAQAETVAEKIRTMLSAPYRLTMSGSGKQWQVEHVCTCSIGIVTIGPGSHDVESILRHADEAMYQAKSQGRNRLCFYAGKT